MEDEDRAKFCYAVDNSMYDLTNTLHTVVEELKLKLFGEFTEGERQEIDCSGTNLRKVTILFETLKTKSVDTHQKCLEALEELKHKEIADKLREKMKTPGLPKEISPRELALSGGK